MGNLWLKIKVWTKLTVFTLVVVYILLFIFQNDNNTAHVWIFWFNHEHDYPVVPLILCTLMAGVIGTLLTRTLLRTIRDLKELRNKNKTEQLHKSIAEMQAKAGKLQTKPGAEVKGE
jgi:uncharacterized integral membrane protein